MLVNIECPVELLDYKLYESKSTGKVYCSLTFNNVSGKVVNGIKIMIYCYDQFGDAVGERNNHIESKIEFKEGLTRNRRRTIENKILLAEFQHTRKIEIDIIKVLFDDRTIWNKDTTVSEIVELIPIDNSNILKFINDCEGPDAIYFAKQKEDKWICICGRLNYDYQSTCKRCERVKEDVLSDYSDGGTISKYLKADKEEIVERKKTEQVERERKLVISKMKTKKVTKYSFIVAAIILIIGVSAFGFMTKFTFSMENYQLLKDRDNGLVEIINDKSLKNDELVIENRPVIGTKKNDEEKAKVVNGIIKSSFVEYGGSNGRGEFTISYRKNGTIKNKMIGDIVRPLVTDIDNNGVDEFVISYGIPLPELSNAQMPYWDDVYDFDITKEELVFASKDYPEYYRSYFIPTLEKERAQTFDSDAKKIYSVLIRAANELIVGNFIPDVNQQKITKLLEDESLSNHD